MINNVYLVIFEKKWEMKGNFTFLAKISVDA